MSSRQSRDERFWDFVFCFSHGFEERHIARREKLRKTIEIKCGVVADHLIPRVNVIIMPPKDEEGDVLVYDHPSRDPDNLHPDCVMINYGLIRAANGELQGAKDEFRLQVWNFATVEAILAGNRTLPAYIGVRVRGRRPAPSAPRAPDTGPGAGVRAAIQRIRPVVQASNAARAYEGERGRRETSDLLHVYRGSPVERTPFGPSTSYELPREWETLMLPATTVDRPRIETCLSRLSITGSNKQEDNLETGGRERRDSRSPTPRPRSYRES